MRHAHTSSMFLDLDKPVLRDPLEQIEAAMEWEAISEMNALRDEERRRLGFVKDLHEERGFALNPITGRYRDAPGFNPPRRIERRGYDDVPIEVKDMILDSMGGFKDRTLTRFVSRSHASLTRSLDEVVDEVMGEVLEEIPRPNVFGRDIYYAERRKKRSFKEWMNLILYTVSKRMLEKLSIPLEVVLSKPNRFKIRYEKVSPTHLNAKVHKYELLFCWDMRLGMTTLHIRSIYDWTNDPSDPEAFWKHYPLIMKIIRRAYRHIREIGWIDNKGAEEGYEMFKKEYAERGH